MSLNEMIMYLIPILIQVESGGKLDAIGDGGKAYGCLQIHQICIDDVNRIYGTDYKHKDAFDKKKAETICYLYLMHWAKKYEDRTGKKVTYEVLSRCWNGGPRGYEKPVTFPYWKKVIYVSQKMEIKKKEF